MNADDIEKIVEELLLAKDIYPKEVLDQRYLEFRTKNRMFYETILNNEFDYLIFEQMMKAKRQLESGRDQFSVDKQFGQFMADRYVTPALKKADQEKESKQSKQSNEEINKKRKLNEN